MTSVPTTESVVTFTPSAVAELKAMLANPDNGGKTLRLYVEQGGCSGMQYGMVFDEKRDGDLVAEQDGVMAYVDPISADFLRGTQVDFSDALTGGGFKLKNPNAKQSCGCGKSFQA